MKIIFKNINVYNYYKYLSAFFITVAFTVFTLGNLGFSHDFFNGLASSFLVLGVILSTMLFLKRKDIDFKENLNQIGKDERMQKKYMKNHSILNHASLALIVSLITISVFYDFSFAIGGTIILWVQLILGFILFIKK